MPTAIPNLDVDPSAIRTRLPTGLVVGVLVTLGAAPVEALTLYAGGQRGSLLALGIGALALPTFAGFTGSYLAGAKMTGEVAYKPATVQQLLTAQAGEYRAEVIASREASQAEAIRRLTDPGEPSHQPAPDHVAVAQVANG